MATYQPPYPPEVKEQAREMLRRGVAPGAVVRILGPTHVTLRRWSDDDYRRRHNQTSARWQRENGRARKRCWVCGGAMWSDGKCGDCRGEERHMLRVEMRRLREENLTTAEVGEALGMSFYAVEKELERGRKDGFDFGRRPPGPKPKRAVQAA